jgi:outer membrane immunogenic protein
MKKLLIATAVAASCFASQAFAQAQNFEGFSIAGNLVITDSKAEVTSTIYNGSASDVSTNLGLQGQYTWALGDKFVLGLGAQLGLGDLGVGTLSGTTADLKGKNWSSFYVAPGYAVSNTLLVYGKLAALAVDIEAAGTKVPFDGIGYGLGVQSYLNKNMFVQGEFMVNDYTDEKFPLFNEVDKYKNTQLSIGIGYKF